MMNTLLKAASFKSTLWLLSEKFLRLLLGILVSSMLARYMGPDEFGALNYALAILAVSLVLSGVGLNRIIVREVVDSNSDAEEQNEIVSTAFYLRLFVSFIILLIVIAYFVSVGDFDLFLVIVLFSLLFSPVSVVDLYSQGVSDLKEISLIRSFVSIVSSVIKISLVLAECDYYTFYLAILIEYIIAAIMIILLFSIRNKKRLFSFNGFSYLRAKKFLYESYPEIASGLSTIMFFKLDQIMLNYFLGDGAVGLYSAATRISEAWYFIPVSIVAATFPFIVKGKAVGVKCYRDRLILLMSVLFLISVTAAMAITLVSNDLIRFLFGEQYDVSADVLVIHCWSGVFMCMGIASGSALAVDKLWHWAFYRTLAGLIVNLVLNYILILEYGIEGAAWATFVSFLVAFFIFDLFVKSKRFMFFDKLRAFNIFNLLKIEKIKLLISGK